MLQKKNRINTHKYLLIIFVFVFFFNYNTTNGDNHMILPKGGKRRGGMRSRGCLSTKNLVKGYRLGATILLPYGGNGGGGTEVTTEKPEKPDSKCRDTHK